MSDLDSILEIPGIEPASRPGNNKRHVLAALISCVVPGAGQLSLGEKRRATILLVSFICLCAGFWPMRLPRTAIGFTLLSVMWIALGIYASVSALLARTRLTKSRPSKWWLLLVIPLSLVSAHFIGGGVFRAAGFRAFTVPSTSMEPTIARGERIVVDTRSYRDRLPARGEVIVFHKDDLYAVKRIIATGGERIEGRNREVLLNGVSLEEPYIEHTLAPGSNPLLDNFGPVAVPPGSYFVIGDNRDVSLDSRYPGYGSISPRSILGKPLYAVRNGWREIQ